MVLLYLFLSMTKNTTEGTFAGVAYVYFSSAFFPVDGSFLQSIMFHLGISWKSSTQGLYESLLYNTNKALLYFFPLYDHCRLWSKSLQTSSYNTGNTDK